MAKKPTQSLGEYFALADTREPRRLIGRSFGEAGGGKTSFWLGGTPPVFVQSFDKGMEGLMAQLIERLGLREVYVRNYKWTPGGNDFSQEYAQSVRAEFETDFYTVLRLIKRGTIVWDKETDIWQMFRYAEFGAPNTQERNDYAKLYSRYAALIDDIKDTELSFGAVQAMKDEWESYVNPKSGKKAGRTTGRRVPQGCDRLDEMVLTDIYHERVKDEAGKSVAFRIALGKSRQNAKLTDQYFDNMSFAELGQLMLPDSEPEEWA